MLDNPEYTLNKFNTYNLLEYKVAVTFTRYISCDLRILGISSILEWFPAEPGLQLEILARAKTNIKAPVGSIGLTIYLGRSEQYPLSSSI